MNTIKIFFFILFFLPYVNLNAQEIPKKANTIIIKGITFKEAMNKFLDNDYIIQSQDSINGYINTEYKYVPQKHSPVMVRVSGRIKDSDFILYGNTKQETLIPNNVLDFGRTENRGQKGSALRQAWDALNAFALSFNKPVEYLVQ